MVADTYDYEWRDRATCNPGSGTYRLPDDAWWPTGRVKPVNVEAAVECRRCPVLEYCRRWVKETKPEHGVVAGEIRIMDAQWVGSTESRTKVRECRVCGESKLLKWFPSAGKCWLCERGAA